MAEAEDDADRARASRRYDELHDRLEHQDAYSIDHRVEEILGGPRLRRRPTSSGRRATFSGGQQSRLMLAKLLLESPDLMLLDEPSNHLDIETTAWLENYLARQPVAMVVVSHDRYFLDKVVTKIWELHEGKIEAYPGNYTQYWRLRTEKAKVLERQAERQAETDRRPARTTSASTARASGPSRPRTARRSWRASSGSRRCARSSARSWASARSTAPATSSSRPATSPRPTTSPCSRT